MPPQVNNVLLNFLLKLKKVREQQQQIYEAYERSMEIDTMVRRFLKILEEREKNKKALKELEKKESMEKSPPNTTQGTDQTSVTDTELAEEDTIVEDAMAPTASRKAYRLNHGSDAPGSSKCASPEKSPLNTTQGTEQTSDTDTELDEDNYNSDEFESSECTEPETFDL